MKSFSQRYTSGDHELVWRELRALGPVPPWLREDVAAVAETTMRRVAVHVARLVERLPGLGFVAHDGSPPHQPPTDADRVNVDRLAEEIGGLPAALAACLREVGAVSLLGDWESANLYYHRESATNARPPGADYPDPLCLPDMRCLRLEWEEYQDSGTDDGEGFLFAVAPDELHKANISGGTHDVALPDPHADPALLGVAGRPGITLVEYLRESITWGGFPGWSFSTTAAPATLAGLAARPDF